MGQGQMVIKGVWRQYLSRTLFNNIYKYNTMVYA